ncbi:MAG: uroporphyrinogen decarboxylase family protein [Chloroflexota bacterium]|nr:uroporphyrinogen decarboxylase family protein [Chloroflexota bacterium]
MTSIPRERVLDAMAHREPERVPRFEIWIDALLPSPGQTDPLDSYVNLGQDCIMLPSKTLPGSNAWATGVDEWGRVWRDGIYLDGVVDSEQDLRRFSPSPELAGQLFDPEEIDRLKARHPDHCLIFGTHVGPFTAAYMAMGFGRFFRRLVDDPGYVDRLLAQRTEWCIALYRQAIALGAEVVVLGDDAAHRSGPMISPQMWRERVWPYHRRIVDALSAPVLWHSDGDIRPLLPAAIDAGFVGVHGLEPAAGIELIEIKKRYGRELVLVGNMDVRVLCDGDLAAVRKEVLRCLGQGAPGGGYMIATCNSIFAGMDGGAVAEMFRLLQAEQD